MGPRQARTPKEKVSDVAEPPAPASRNPSPSSVVSTPVSQPVCSEAHSSLTRPSVSRPLFADAPLHERDSAPGPSVVPAPLSSIEDYPEPDYAYIKRILEENVLSVRFKTRDREELRILFILFSVKQHLREEDLRILYGRLRLFYIVYLYGWPVAMADAKEQESAPANIVLSSDALRAGRQRTRAR